MFLKKYQSFIVVILVVWLVLAGCTAPEESPAPTVTVEVPPEPTETAPPTATELPAPTNTAAPDPTATPVPYPSARGFHNLVYDSGSNKILLIGGSSEAFIKPLKEIWAYETASNTWSLVESIKSDHPTAAYVAEKGQTIIYTSVRVVSASEGKISAKLHSFDLASHTVERIEDESLPIGYAFSPLVYDSESKRVILFGGWILDDLNTYHNETYAYDPITNTWTQMNPESPPLERSFHMMVYHPTMDRVILLGGDFLFSAPDTDTWAYDFNSDSWTLLEAENMPPRSEGSSMVYVSSTDQVILFGGINEGVPQNDMWAFDHVENTWIELNPKNPPSPRAYHAMAYDSANDKIILFGGGITDNASDLTNDTWIYDPQTNTWTDMTPGN